MDRLWASITEWLKEVLINGITSNLAGMFDSTFNIPASGCVANMTRIIRNSEVRK